MPFNWLLRAVRWVRNPPSMRQALMLLALVSACIALAAYERVYGWPEILTVEPLRPPR